jgi:hypothetical protein
LPPPFSTVHPGSLRSRDSDWLIIYLLVDSRATFSLLTEWQSLLSKSSQPIMGISGKIEYPHITPSVLYTIGDLMLTHSFLLMPQCPISILGKDLLHKLGAFLRFSPLPLPPHFFYKKSLMMTTHSLILSLIPQGLLN